jgi:hypothetical protein
MDVRIAAGKITVNSTRRDRAASHCHKTVKRGEIYAGYDGYNPAQYALARCRSILLSAAAATSGAIRPY